jgi:hypothetical protein
MELGLLAELRLQVDEVRCEGARPDHVDHRHIERGTVRREHPREL